MTINERVRDLQVRLEAAEEKERRRARIFHLAWALAITAALSSSLIAGVGGLFFDMPKNILARLALIPGIAGVVATSLKLHERANYFYRKRNGIKELWRRLVYEYLTRPAPMT